MAQTDVPHSSEEESLKTLFDEAMQMFDRIENGSEATNSDAVQVWLFSFIFCNETLHGSAF